MGEDMTKDEIDELRALHEAATPDWDFQQHGPESDKHGTLFGWYSRENRTTRTIASFLRYGSIVESVANALLAVKARNAVPRLLSTLAAKDAKIEAKEAENAKLRACLKDGGKTESGVPLALSTTLRSFAREFFLAEQMAKASIPSDRLVVFRDWRDWLRNKADKVEKLVDELEAKSE